MKKIKNNPDTGASKSPDPVAVEHFKPDTAAILPLVMAIVEERNGYLRELKVALQKDDISEIKKWAWKLVGLAPDSLPKL